MITSRRRIFDLLNLQNTNIGTFVSNIQTEDTISLTYDTSTDALILETIEDKISQKITVIDGGSL